MTKRQLPARRRSFVVLLGLFLRRFVSVESVAPGGQARLVVVGFLSALALPGYVVALATVTGALRRAMAHRGGIETWLWSERWFLLVISGVVVGLLSTLQWESLFLDGRDRNCLGILPVSRRTIILAKLASLVVIVGALHLAINTLPGMVLALATPTTWTNMVMAHNVTLLLQTIFVVFGVASLQGTARLLLPSRLGRPASLIIQTGLLVAFAALLAAQGDLARLARETHGKPNVLNTLLPTAWFMALYNHILGINSPHNWQVARLAIIGPLLATGAVVPLLLLRSRQTEGLATTSTIRILRLLTGPFGQLLDRAVSSPQGRAVAFFVRRAASGTPANALLVRAWFSVGIALTVVSMAYVFLDPRLMATEVNIPLLAPAFVLPFFGLVGLRLSATIPSHLEANWLFRLGGRTCAREFVPGVRVAALRAIVIPLFVLLFPPYVFLLGSALAIKHLLFALAVALLTNEALFFDFPKIPFTCSYVPGKSKPFERWPLYVLLVFTYWSFLPSLELLSLRHDAAFWTVTGLVAGAGWFVAARRYRRASVEELIFNEKTPSIVVSLGLGNPAPTAKVEGNSTPRIFELTPPESRREHLRDPCA